MGKDILMVSSRDFRNNQKTFFDLVSEGTKVIITRKDKFYSITPLEENDIEILFREETERKIDTALKQVKEGKVKTIKGIEELQKFIDKL